MLFVARNAFSAEAAEAAVDVNDVCECEVAAAGVADADKSSREGADVPWPAADLYDCFSEMRC